MSLNPPMRAGRRIGKASDTIGKWFLAEVKASRIRTSRQRVHDDLVHFSRGILTNDDADVLLRSSGIGDPEL